MWVIIKICTLNFVHYPSRRSTNPVPLLLPQPSLSLCRSSNCAASPQPSLSLFRRRPCVPSACAAVVLVFLVIRSNNRASLARFDTEGYISDMVMKEKRREDDFGLKEASWTSLSDDGQW
ncbi:hypothetical protein ACFE04_026675 [Oxalis oulophora]